VVLPTNLDVDRAVTFDAACKEVGTTVFGAPQGPFSVGGQIFLGPLNVSGMTLDQLVPRLRSRPRQRMPCEDRDAPRSEGPRADWRRRRSDAAVGRLPGAMAFLGARLAGLDPATAPKSHSNLVVFDEDAMAVGVALHAAVAIRHLTAPRGQASPRQGCRVMIRTVASPGTAIPRPSTSSPAG
jgi:hypothetical protein